MQCIYNSLTQDYRRATETLQAPGQAKLHEPEHRAAAAARMHTSTSLPPTPLACQCLPAPPRVRHSGNLMQAVYPREEFADLAGGRAAIKRSFEIKEYNPQ